MESFQDIGEDMQSQTLVWNHILAVVDTMVLKCALKLRLFDVINSYSSANCHISLTELATSLALPSTRITTLRRIMRYLAHMCLVNINYHTTTYEETYILTNAASIYLREGSEKSYAAFVRFLIEEDMLTAMHELDTYLVKKDEKLPIEMVKGEKFFDLMGRDEALSKRFNDAMTGTTKLTVEAILMEYPTVFEGVKVMVDVGGGAGNVARVVAKTFSCMKCIVYDLPHVVKEEMEIEGVVYKTGDMFVYVPPADAYLIMRVLHNWNDEKALEILKHCREAIVGDKGKLIIVDMIIEEKDIKDINHIKLASDIIMMTYFGGRERTEIEWRSLLFQASFRHCTITSIKTLQHVIEANP